MPEFILLISLVLIKIFTDALIARPGPVLAGLFIWANQGKTKSILCMHHTLNIERYLPISDQKLRTLLMCPHIQAALPLSITGFNTFISVSSSLPTNMSTSCSLIFKLLDFPNTLNY